MTAIFRENVIDILEEWEFYPVKVPVCPEGGRPNNPAYNAGHVQVRCYINNTCPFYKTPKKEDGIIFNDSTFLELKDAMQASVTNVLSVTPGMEGIHFKPRQVLRHNYMYDLDVDVLPEDSLPPDYSTLLADFDTYYNDISLNHRTSPVVGSDETRYMEEQSWFVWPSVFEDLSCDPNGSDECSIKARWTYFPQPVGDSDITDWDVSYDYNAQYYQDYKNSYEDDQVTLKPKQTTRIQKYIAQMPMQARVHDDDVKGVHWRVVKRTPLFRGEDFFVRFYKQSQEPVIPSDRIAPKSFTDSYYFPLDVTQESTVKFDPVGSFEKKINDAIRPPEKSVSEATNLNIYDLYSQAYYVIELNPYDLETNYFIIIPERGNPTFVHFFKTENSTGTISRRLGDPFDGITGQRLIEADWFDVIVRNHLGKLVIQFKGDFPEVRPWIIIGNLWEVQYVPNTQDAYMVEKPQAIIVPRGRMSIWGGNIKCGFLFGPLQYYAKQISFVYPPRELDMGADATEDMNSAFVEADPIQTTYSANYFEKTPLWLPLNGPAEGYDTNHRFLFQAYDNFLEKGSVGNEFPSFPNVKLFTQDAQFYKNYDESDDADTDWQLGYFYYNWPIKDFSDVIGAKTSNITVRKYKYVNDDKTRHQGFDVWIGMMAGDHVFTSAYWLGGSPTVAAFHGEAVISSSDVLSDDKWYVPDCKTPIVTTLRLVSDSGQDPRWYDGTTISTGMSRDPLFGFRSPYLIDATEHVMAFSHTWTSSSLTSMEHSGMIQFYLNDSMDVPEGSVNVTQALLSLQDKTFYIEVWAGYEICNYTKIPGFYKMFTGVCEGGTISYEYGKNIMTCKLEDYTVVLNGMKFFNSPWFDGLKDVIAINEIMRLAGFRDQGAYDPGRLISDLAQSAINNNPNIFFNHFDGRVFKFAPFALPSGYNRLEQPALKFNDGDPFIDAVTKISRMSSKMFYFDEYGVAHYEDFQDIVEQDFLGGLSLVPLYQFTTNPEVIGGQLVFNKVERSFDVASVFNHIKVLTNTPEMHLLIRDNLNWRSMENPEMTGFLGYQRTFYQAESLFGSYESQKATVKKYSSAFKPKIKVSFETYGLPLRATDIVSLENEVIRVTKVNHTFDPAANRWWMQVECERYQPIDPTTVQ